MSQLVFEMHYVRSWRAATADRQILQSQYLLNGGQNAKTATASEGMAYIANANQIVCNDSKH